MATPRNKMSPFAQELLQSMEQALAYLKGEGTARETRLFFPDPPPKVTPIQIQALRKRFDMTQIQFARLMNVSTKTIEGWEQGLRTPSGVALRMLECIDDPKIITHLMQVQASSKPDAPSKYLAENQVSKSKSRRIAIGQKNAAQARRSK